MPSIKWIPIDIVQDVIRNRMSNAFLIYILLNIDHNGFAIKSKSLIEGLKKKSGFKSPKTIRKHLKKLVDVGWLGFDNNTYYIRSMHYINEVLIKGKTTRSVEFGAMYLSRWKPYLIGAMVGYLAYSQRLKEIAENQRKGIKKMGIPNQKPLISASYPVAHSSIKKIFYVTTTTAHQYKKLANQAGFISVQSNHRKVNFSIKSHLFFKAVVGGKSKYFIKNGKVYERLPDQVSFHLVYRGGKKKKYIRWDIREEVKLKNPPSKKVDLKSPYKGPKSSFCCSSTFSCFS